MNDFIYYRQTLSRPETVEYVLHDDCGEYQTTCVINVSSIEAGIRTFPCGNGDDFEFADNRLYLKLLNFIDLQRQNTIKWTLGTSPGKKLENWRNCCLKFEDYFTVGDLVDNDIVEEIINSVPPVTYCSYCTQAGEAFSFAKDSNGVAKDVFITFAVFNDKWWKFKGYCFQGCTENQIQYKSKIQQLIEQIEKEIK